MKVKTLRQHTNAHRPTRVKNPGRIYEVSDEEAAQLIEAGFVVAHGDDRAEPDED